MTNRDYSYNGWCTPMQRGKTYDKQGLISTPLVPMSTPVQVQENQQAMLRVGIKLRWSFLPGFQAHVVTFHSCFE